MASRTKLLTELTVADLWKEVKDPEHLWGDLTPELMRTVKLLLHNRMYEELAQHQVGIELVQSVPTAYNTVAEGGPGP